MTEDSGKLKLIQNVKCQRLCVNPLNNYLSGVNNLSIVAFQFNL